MTDDDSVIVPAPDVSVFLHSRKPAPRNSQAASAARALSMRRTIIPMLLTGGLICAAIGILRFIWPGEDNPLIAVPVWLTGVLFLLAAVLWILAAVNMTVVKQMLDSRSR